MGIHGDIFFFTQKMGSSADSTITTTTTTTIIPFNGIICQDLTGLQTVNEQPLVTNFDYFNISSFVPNELNFSMKLFDDDHEERMMKNLTIKSVGGDTETE